MEKNIKTNLIYQGKVLDLYCDDVSCDNGLEAKREIIHHSGGAGVLLVNDKKEILLIKQYRYAYNEELLEIPAGKLEKNEDSYKAALRELEEETGYKTEKLKPLGKIYPTCGYSNEIIYLYLASDFIKTQTNFDPDENISKKWYKLNEVLELIDNGTIKDAKTIVAVYRYLYLKK